MPCAWGEDDEIQIIQEKGMEDNESILEKSKQLKTYYEISLSMDMISLASKSFNS